MPPIDRLAVLRAILDDGVVPIFNAPDPDVAFDFVAGCARGGARLVEFTNRGDFAHATFVELARRMDRELPGTILGAGTIADAPTAAMFIAAGARFIVGHVLVPDVARLCNRRRVAYIPGCGSATEIGQAEELGCEIVKLFPAAAFDGPAFVRGILGPSPASRIMPTNVVATEETTRAWIGAGAAALGVAMHLYPPDLVAARDPAEVARRTELVLGWVRAARLAGDGPAAVPAQAGGPAPAARLAAGPSPGAGR
jgi:2-dehydro-3-deoxyphosphogluconate aldolase / (4S)-4-hydroxy-2-oxoglutarate aldolase